MDFLGIQKYFIAGLLALVLIAGGTTAIYRASYISEQLRRTEVETALQQSTQALNDLTKSHAAQMAAVAAATQATRAIGEQRRVTRERIIQAPNDQDGPISPVLRCAVTGVC